MKKISNRVLLCILFFACVVDFLSLDIHLPNIVAMQNDLHTTKFMVQLVFIAASSISWIVQLFWGQFSDSYGRRNTIVVGMAMVIVGQIGCIFATTIEFLLFARIFEFLFVGAVWAAVTGLCADTFNDEKKLASVLSTLDLLYPVSIIVAPIIGAFLGEYVGWRGCFAFLAVLQIIAFVFIYFYIPETIAKTSKLNIKIIVANYKEIMKNKKYMLLNLTSCFIIAPLIMFTTHSAYLYINYFKCSSMSFSLYQAVPSLIGFFTVIVYIYAIKKTPIAVVEKYGVSFMILYCLLSILFLFNVFPNTPIVLALLMGVLIIAEKTIDPGILAQFGSIFKDKIASAFAFHFASLGVIVMPMTTLCARNFDKTPTPSHVIYWMLFPALFSIFLCFYKARKKYN